MATLLFVHGTGVRRDVYEGSLGRIRAGLAATNVGRTTAVEGCLWGDPLGTRLQGGASIPEYQERGGQPPPTEEELELELWMHLYEDPLYELRVLGIGPLPPGGAPGQARPRDVLDGFAKQLTVGEDAREVLRAGGIDSYIKAATSRIIESSSYAEFLTRVPQTMGFFQAALARAIVAEAIAMSSDERGVEPPIASDAAARNEVALLLQDQLGPRQAGVGKWIVRGMLGATRATAGRGVAIVGSSLAKWRRGRMSDASSPAAGDILLYQSRGGAIRDFVKARAKELTPPVVLLGHSLGGIACAELLIANDLRDHVALLITVGSQAPYFYEINALQTLEYGRRLPDHVPRWINIYDLRDFLSYIGGKTFQGRVQDVEVNNRQPFPQSHSAYWNNPQVFAEIANAMTTHT